MLELPEALNIAAQINDTVKGKLIARVTAAHTPHKFAWYHNDPQTYPDLLVDQTIGLARGIGSMVEITAGTTIILISDGSRLTYHAAGDIHPQKHQLLIEFEDSSALSVSVQMYGGVWVFPLGELDDPYYETAKTKPSPLSSDFDSIYFKQMISAEDVQKLSTKEFLATKQRIPGLGNGVLQDILFNAKIHPKRKISTLSEDERAVLYQSVKDTLAEMSSRGGRDTEKDLFKQAGGYKTKLSKNSAGKPCPECNNTIKKESYLGGSIYYCDKCQIQ